MKQVHRKSDVQSTDAVLNLFDMLTLEEFEKITEDDIAYGERLDFTQFSNQFQIEFFNQVGEKENIVILHPVVSPYNVVDIFVLKQKVDEIYKLLVNVLGIIEMDLFLFVI
jgi:hypothetical protein